MIYTQSQLNEILSSYRETITILESEIKRLQAEVENQTRRAEIAIDRILMKQDIAPISPAIIDATNKQNVEIKQLFSGLEQIGGDMSEEEDAHREREKWNIGKDKVMV